MHLLNCSTGYVHNRMSTATGAADFSWSERRIRSADLAQERDTPHIPIPASEHTGSDPAAAQSLVEESETEFSVSDSRAKKDRAVGRERTRGAHYGAITQGLAPQDEENEKVCLLPPERKRSVATAGKAYERVASRNKRAEHATTYVITCPHIVAAAVTMHMCSLASHTLQSL